MEKYEIAYLTSGADILSTSLPRSEPRQALFLVANPNYDSYVAAQSSESRPLQRTGRVIRFDPLSYTKIEAEAIPPLVSGSENQKVVICREQPTKEAVKAAHRPRILSRGCGVASCNHTLP